MKSRLESLRGAAGSHCNIVRADSAVMTHNINALTEPAEIPHLQQSTRGSDGRDLVLKRNMICLAGVSLVLSH